MFGSARSTWHCVGFEIELVSRYSSMLEVGTKLLYYGK